MAQARLLWEDVDSSNVNRIGYHDDSETLCVEFRNGGLYSYNGVTPDDYHGLMGAESVGRYLNQVIKVSYPYTKFDTEDDLLAFLVT